ncbi:MAG: ROK family protein, partial [Candidatus Micrarchaeaceae archaeon]
PFHGKRVFWESFASGHAIVQRFGKKAADITDPATWQRIAHDLAMGFVELIAIAQPQIIVIGGGVGTYYDRFEPFLLQELQQIKNPLIDLPIIRKAARPEDAVLYGCYDLARNTYGTYS